MTYKEFEAFAAKKILETCPYEQKDSGIAAFQAKTLVCHFSGLATHELILKKDEIIPDGIKELLTDALEKKLSGEPLQYILGEWEFYGHRIFCGKGCLIPRPETELACESAIGLLPGGGRFLDLCTGSGCISAAILLEREDADCVSVDISDDALVFAKKNAEYHKITDRMSIEKADALSYIPKGLFDIVISNPPYIKSADMKGLSKEVLHEPALALDGGEDGLIFYKRITHNCAPCLTDGGAIIFETGYDIADEVEDIVKSAGLETETVFDFSGNKRVVIGKNKGCRM